MINRLHYLLHRPEKGWDPISPQHGKPYADYEWSHLDNTLLDTIETKWGSLSDKTVLDLGAGPGHYSSAFALRGAKVTWFDVSQFYLDYAKQKITGLSTKYPVTFIKGYLEEASRLKTRFDIVFNRICYCYSINDFKFARLIHNLIKDTGHGYIMSNHLGFIKKWPFTLKVKVWINEKTGYKIGHPFCSKRRIQEAIAQCDFKEISYRFDDDNIYLWLTK